MIGSVLPAGHVMTIGQQSFGRFFAAFNALGAVAPMNSAYVDLFTPVTGIFIGIVLLRVSASNKLEDPARFLRSPSAIASVHGAEASLLGSTSRLTICFGGPIVFSFVMLFCRSSKYASVKLFCSQCMTWQVLLFLQGWTGSGYVVTRTHQRRSQEIDCTDIHSGIRRSSNRMLQKASRGWREPDVMFKSTPGVDEGAYLFGCSKVYSTREANNMSTFSAGAAFSRALSSSAAACSVRSSP